VQPERSAAAAATQAAAAAAATLTAYRWRCGAHARRAYDGAVRRRRCAAAGAALPRARLNGREGAAGVGAAPAPLAGSRGTGSADATLRLALRAAGSCGAAVTPRPNVGHRRRDDARSASRRVCGRRRACASAFLKKAPKRDV
jgi:hypothetical protein